MMIMKLFCCDSTHSFIAIRIISNTEMEKFTLVVVNALLLALTSPFSFFCGFAHGLDMESAKETPCFQISKTVPLDIEWVMSTKQWYYPLMSRLDLYFTSVHVSGKPAKELLENELYYESCMRHELKGGNSWEATSFGNRKKISNVRPIKGIEIYEFEISSGDYGTVYTTLTNNETFFFTAVCFPGDQMGWSVLSTEKSLPSETVQLIHKHAESLGFKREYFTGLRYDYCEGDEAEEKTEL